MSDERPTPTGLAGGSNLDQLMPVCLPFVDQHPLQWQRERFGGFLIDRTHLTVKLSAGAAFGTVNVDQDRRVIVGRCIGGGVQGQIGCAGNQSRQAEQEGYGSHQSLM